MKRARWLAFERRHEPLASREVFRGRLIRSSLVAFAIISVSLVMGMVGYRVFGRLDSWVDCLYNASMILGDMGPVAELHTDAVFQWLGTSPGRRRPQFLCGALTNAG